MQDFQRNKKLRRKIYSRNVTIVLVIITVLLVRGAVSVVEKQRESKRNLEEVRAALAEAKQRDIELSKDIELINTQAGVEREIREKYSVAKFGEEVVVIVDPSTDSDDVEAVPKGFWARIGGWFSGWFGE